MEPKFRTIAEKSFEPCLICGTPTSKLHLQVNSCYACAAFFRRSLSVHKDYKCQNYTKNCNLKIQRIGKPLCRYCRYQKCEEVGMRIINTTNPTVKTVKKDDETIVEAPVNTKNFNMDSIHASINKIFKEQKIIRKEFSELLKDFIEFTKPKKPLISIINDDIRVKFIEKVFVETSKMLSSYSPFLKLGDYEKILVHQHVWQIYHLFATCYHAVNNFGKDINDMRLPVDNYQYFDFNNHFRQYESNPGFQLLLKPLSDKIKTFLKQFKKLNISFHELSYLFEIVLWSVQELPSISFESQQLAEQRTQKLSYDLHFYYLNKQKNANYSSRQSKMFLLINLAESIIREKSQMILAKSVFDFGDNQFGYCKFETDYFNYLRYRK